MIEPYYSREGITLYHGDAMNILPRLIDACGKADACITDPPYGVGKAEWDVEFPTAWYAFAREASETIYTMPGLSALPLCMQMVGSDYQDTISIWLSNGMTRGPLGFGNWIPVVVSQKERRFLGGQNAFRVVVNPSEEIDHPSPKPIDAMVKLIFSREHNTIIDPFIGSGTTSVACIRTGRKCIGIEIEEKYCEIAAKRCEAEFDRTALIEPAMRMTQPTLDGID